MMNKTWYRYALAGVLASSLIATVQAGDWTRWRGPNGDGSSAENGWNPRALSAGSSVLWKTNVGRGHSTVAVKGNRVYTMGTVERRGAGETSYEEVVLCLDATTGEEVWRYAYPVDHQPFHGPGATPVLDDGLLYTVSRAGVVLCFVADAGSVVFKRDLVDEQLATGSMFGFNGSPVVDGELLLLNVASSGVALNKRTGKVVWASETAASSNSSPVPFSHGDQRLAAFPAAQHVQVAEVATGKVLWSWPWQSDTDPIIVGSRMLLVGGRGASSSVLLDFSSGKPVEVWKSRALGDVFQNAVVVGEYVFRVGRNSGRMKSLQCVNLKDGELAWSHDLGDWGGLIAVDNKLVIVADLGELIVAEATPTEFRRVASTKLFDLKPMSSYEERDQPNCCWIAPVLANGKVYVRDSWGDLACVDVS